jgi:hypothetical protein
MQNTEKPDFSNSIADTNFKELLCSIDPELGVTNYYGSSKSHYTYFSVVCLICVVALIQSLTPFCFQHNKILKTKKIKCLLTIIIQNKKFITTIST